MDWLLCLFTACDPYLETVCPFDEGDYSCYITKKPHCLCCLPTCLFSTATLFYIEFDASNHPLFCSQVLQTLNDFRGRTIGSVGGSCAARSLPANDMVPEELVQDPRHMRCGVLMRRSAGQDGHNGGLANILCTIFPFIMSQIGPCVAKDVFPNSFSDLDQFARRTAAQV